MFRKLSSLNGLTSTFGSEHHHHRTWTAGSGSDVVHLETDLERSAVDRPRRRPGSSRFHFRNSEDNSATANDGQSKRTPLPPSEVSVISDGSQALSANDRRSISAIHSLPLQSTMTTTAGCMQNTRNSSLTNRCVNSNGELRLTIAMEDWNDEPPAEPIQTNFKNGPTSFSIDSNNPLKDRNNNIKSLDYVAQVNHQKLNNEPKTCTSKRVEISSIQISNDADYEHNEIATSSQNTRSKEKKGEATEAKTNLLEAQTKQIETTTNDNEEENGCGHATEDDTDKEDDNGDEEDEDEEEDDAELNEEEGDESDSEDEDDETAHDDQDRLLRCNHSAYVKSSKVRSRSYHHHSHHHHPKCHLYQSIRPVRCGQSDDPIVESSSTQPNVTSSNSHQILLPCNHYPHHHPHRHSQRHMQSRTDYTTVALHESALSLESTLPTQERLSNALSSSSYVPLTIVSHSGSLNRLTIPLRGTHRTQRSTRHDIASAQCPTNGAIHATTFSDTVAARGTDLPPPYVTQSNDSLSAAAQAMNTTAASARPNGITTSSSTNGVLTNEAGTRNAPNVPIITMTTASNSTASKTGWTFLFDPSGRISYYWSMIVSLAFLYNFWVIIYRFAFEEISASTMVVWLTLDSIADVIYVLDIGVNFRSGFLEEGVLQADPIKLRQHYMNSTMFYIDCLCLLPLDFLYLSIGFLSILRAFRLVKIYRFWSFLDRTERHSNYPNLFRMCSLTHYILVTFHWNACLYHLIWRRGLFANSRDSTCSDPQCDYLHAFYWSTLALTITGDLPRPSTKAEYLFLTLELLCGLFLFAAVLGHVAIIVTNVSTARKEFQAKLDSVKTYMRMRRVPEHLKNKVIRWFDYLWMTQKSSDEDKCVGFLPAKLKAEIAIHVHLDTLKRVEIFQNTEAGFLCALVLRLKPILFSPGDYVCRKGEVGKEMYIVSRGKLQVVSDGGCNVLATLRAGSYFGEISVLNLGTAGNRRTASVRSVGYSDLFCLSKQDMWDVLKDYPAARVRLESIACKRMEKYKKEPLKKLKSRNAVIGEPVDTDPIVSTSAHSTLRRRMAHPMQTAHPSPASLGAGYDMDSRGSSLLSHPLPNRTASATVQADHQTHSVHHHQSHHHYHLQPPQHSSHHFRDNSMSAMLPVSGMRTSGKVKPSCMSPNESVLVIDHRLGITPNTLSLPDAVSGRNSSGTPLLQTFDTNPSQPLLSASMPSNLPIPGSKLASTYGKDYYESASRQAISSLPTSNTRSPMPREYGPMLTVSSIPVPTSGSSMHLSLSPMPTLSPLPQQALLISATPDTHLVTHSSAAPDVLFDQIRQLNQRLQTLEAENALLSNRLAEQRMTVHNRLSVLQQQLDRPTSSGGCPPADEQPLVASVHGNESIANVMSHSPRMSFKRNETKSRSQHSNAHAFSTDARSEMIAGERAPSPATVQLFNDPDLEDQELISILSEDSERNKESTI